MPLEIEYLFAWPQQAHSRESETFVDFREKFSFFIGPHK